MTFSLLADQQKEAAGAKQTAPPRPGSECFLLLPFLLRVKLFLRRERESFVRLCQTVAETKKGEISADAQSSFSGCWAARWSRRPRDSHQNGGTIWNQTWNLSQYG